MVGDKRAVWHLIGVLNDDIENFRAMAASALGNIGDERAVGPLIKLLDDNYDGVKHAYIEVLGLIGDDRALKPILAFVSHEDEELRSVGIMALGNMRAKTEIDTLINALNDTSGKVRFCAVNGLARMDDIRVKTP